jgi:hypothetical protein
MPMVGLLYVWSWDRTYLAHEYDVRAWRQRNRPRSLGRFLVAVPQCNCFVYGQACAVMKSAKQEPALTQLKYCVVDSFHAHRHSKKCQCNPCRLASFWSQLEPQPYLEIWSFVVVVYVFFWLFYVQGFLLTTSANASHSSHEEVDSPYQRTWWRPTLFFYIKSFIHFLFYHINGYRKISCIIAAEALIWMINPVSFCFVCRTWRLVWPLKRRLVMKLNF